MCERILLQNLFCLLWQLHTVSYSVGCYLGKYYYLLVSELHIARIVTQVRVLFQLQFSATESRAAV